MTTTPWSSKTTTSPTSRSSTTDRRTPGQPREQRIIRATHRGRASRRGPLPSAVPRAFNEAVKQTHLMRAHRPRSRSARVFEHGKGHPTAQRPRRTRSPPAPAPLHSTPLQSPTWTLTSRSTNLDHDHDHDHDTTRANLDNHNHDANANANANHDHDHHAHGDNRTRNTARQRPMPHVCSASPTADSASKIPAQPKNCRGDHGVRICGAWIDPAARGRAVPGRRPRLRHRHD